jgi:hypothetical protein
MRYLWFLVFLTLGGCDNNSNEDGDKLKNEMVNLNVELGQPVEVVLGSSPLEFSKDCLAAVDMCWYEVRRAGKDQSLINLFVNQPESITLIERVVGLSFVVNGGKTNSVEELVVTLRGLPDNSFHEENKALVYALIAELKSAGWARYYFPSDPRISGVELNKVNSADGFFGERPFNHPLFDPDYEVSLSEWLATDGFYDWYMYSGDYMSHVTVQRRNSSVDPARTVIYLIDVEFMSLDNFWRRDFKEAVRPKWKELFPAHLQQLRNKRLVTEARAKAAGVSIDENYLPPRMERVK